MIDIEKLNEKIKAEKELIEMYKHTMKINDDSEDTYSYLIDCAQKILSKTKSANVAKNKKAEIKSFNRAISKMIDENAEAFNNIEEATERLKRLKADKVIYSPPTKKETKEYKLLAVKRDALAKKLFNKYIKEEVPVKEVIRKILDNKEFQSVEEKIELRRLAMEHTRNIVPTTKYQLSVHPALGNPTTCYFDWWILANADKQGNRVRGKHGGKWLLFCSPESVNETWNKLLIALGNGELGDAIKCSTAYNNINYGGSKHAICIYVHTEDETEIMRVRESLRKIGITWKIPYKTNAKTLEGKYAKNGDRVSSYYC